MEVIFFITLFLYIFIFGSCTDFVDYDFFARMIVGKTFFQTGDVLKYDFLSYSATHPWWDHEWGASLFFYFVHDRFGDLGLQFFKAACLFGTFFIFVLIIKLRRKILSPDKKFPIFNFLFFFVMIQPIANLIFSLRCHHFTFFFFALWLYILEKSRLEENYRILWVLPPLMMVWSNIHGGCFMGLGILGIYIIGEFLGKKRFMPYVYTFLASFAFMFVNPYGVGYVKFLIQAATMARPNIIEWQPLFKNIFAVKFIKYKIFLAGFILISLYRFFKVRPKFRDFDKTKFLLVLAMLLLMLKSVRFISYFIFVIIPFCYDDYYAVFSKQLPEKINRAKELVIFAFILAAFILNVAVRDLKYSSFHSIFPLSEVEFLLENDIHGNIFAPFEIGSYIAYKLFPGNFILHDGRYEEVYPPSLNDDYVRKIVVCNYDWRDKLNSIHHDILILYKNSPIYKLLQQHEDYYRIMESKTFALFLRKDLYNSLKKPFKIPTDNPDFYKKTLWNTQINWAKK